MSAASFLPCSGCRFPGDCESRGCWMRGEQNEIQSSRSDGESTPMSDARRDPLGGEARQSGAGVAPGLREAFHSSGGGLGIREPRSIEQGRARARAMCPAVSRSQFVASAYDSSQGLTRREAANSIRATSRRFFACAGEGGMHGEKRFQFVWRLSKGLSTCVLFMRSAWRKPAQSTDKFDRTLTKSSAETSARWPSSYGQSKPPRRLPPLPTPTSALPPAGYLASLMRRSVSYWPLWTRHSASIRDSEIRRGVISAPVRNTRSGSSVTLISRRAEAFTGRAA